MASFRVWIVGDSAEDAEQFNGCIDAEEAAKEFAYARAHSGDTCNEFLDGDPVQVFVSDMAGKVLGCYEVGAETNVWIKCEEVDMEDDGGA